MGTGRPKKEISMDTFRGLCRIQCTEAEIAAVFECSIDTIERWCKREFKQTFADVYKKLSAGGKVSLRRTQFKLAETSTAMAIFLGKQYLGQKDQPEMIEDDVLRRAAEILTDNRGVID